MREAVDSVCRVTLLLLLLAQDLAAKAFLVDSEREEEEEEEELVEVVGNPPPPSPPAPENRGGEGTWVLLPFAGGTQACLKVSAEGDRVMGFMPVLSPPPPPPSCRLRSMATKRWYSPMASPIQWEAEVLVAAVAVEVPMELEVFVPAVKKVPAVAKEADLSLCWWR